MTGSPHSLGAKRVILRLCGGSAVDHAFGSAVATTIRSWSRWRCSPPPRDPLVGAGTAESVRPTISSWLLLIGPVD
jgi:hypothetical protein